MQNQQTFGNTNQFGQNLPNTTVTRAPTTVERLEKPVVVHEKILPSQTTEVQPVIHIDREQTEVHKVVQPLRERDIAPTQVQHMQLPAQRFESRANDATFQTQYRQANAGIHSDTVIAPTTTTSFEKAPIVHENIHKKVIEEVQPVLYKETFQPTVIEAVKPIYENIVEAPVLAQETLPTRDLGTRGSLPVRAATVQQAPVVTVAPTTVERIEKAAIVHEKILPSQRTEVQPVVHIDREQTEVHKVLQPMKERDIAPTQIQHVQLPEQRFESRAPDTQFQTQLRSINAGFQSDSVVLPTTSTSVEKAPIVHENIHKKVIEEVQPILYKETFRPTVIEAVKPIYENIVEAPILTEQVLPMRDLGTKILPGFQNLSVREAPVLAPAPLVTGVPVEKVTLSQTTNSNVSELNPTLRHNLEDQLAHGHVGTTTKAPLAPVVGAQSHKHHLPFHSKKNNV